jgi:hypothetical protein
MTIVELIVSGSITLCLTAAMFAAVRPAEAIFAVESEAADMQQRLRGAAGVLFKDLLMAGAGTDSGLDAGPLADFVPAVLPNRQARTGGDAPDSFRSDAITVMYVPSRRGQATIGHAFAAASGVVRVDSGFGCPIVDAACGLSTARTVLIYDANGSFDRFRVDRVDGSLLTLYHSTADSPKVYAAGSRIVEAIIRTYFLNADGTTGSLRLMRDDGDGNPAVPVADHVVQLRFEYFGDSRPPASPPAPGAAERPTSYPPGENCVMRRDEMSMAAPRLDALEPVDATGLALLSSAILSDGPWCPDAGAANRFDADLFRLRRIAVTVGVESADASTRGRAGHWFVRAGTSDSGGRFLPDRTLRLVVSPRNLRLAR